MPLKLKKLTMITFIAITSNSLIGCAVSKPDSFQVSIEGNGVTDRLSDETKESVFLDTIYALHSNNQFRPVSGSSKRYAAPSMQSRNTISYNGLNAFYSYQFERKGNVLSMIDNSGFSSEKKGDTDAAYCNLCDDFGFVGYINQFQHSLSSQYPLRLEWYAEFKARYDAEEPEFKKKLARVEVKINDKTGTLPNSVLRALIQKQTIAQRNSFISVSHQGLQSLVVPSIDDSVRTALSIEVLPKTAKLDRFNVHYSKDEHSSYYKDTPNVVEYEIDRVKFDFMPTQYSMSDKSIDVSVEGSTMKITNKTNNYLNVESISAYYNQDIETFRPTTLNLPPRAFKTYKLNTKSQNARTLDVKSANQEVQYGFAIAYFNQDIDVRKTLFKTKAYSLTSF